MTTTGDRIALLELVEKQADEDLGGETMAFAAAQNIETEIETRTGGAKRMGSPLREV